MKKRSVRQKSITEKSKTGGISPANNTGRSFSAYGDKITLCINTDCLLRKKAGGCLGFEGCPGFKSR